MASPPLKIVTYMIIKNNNQFNCQLIKCTMLFLKSKLINGMDQKKTGQMIIIVKKCFLTL